jgi:hypothetical protein
LVALVTGATKGLPAAAHSLHYLVGTGFVPRETSPAELLKSAPLKRIQGMAADSNRQQPQSRVRSASWARRLRRGQVAPQAAGRPRSTVPVPEGVRRFGENHLRVRVLGVLTNLLAGLVSVGAGIYLLAQYGETGPTWLEVIAHGSGAFFVACGLYMLGSSIVAASER